MDPISIKITFQEVPQELINYALCLFYLVAIILCTIILSLFAQLFESFQFNIRDVTNRRDYLYIPNDETEPGRGRV